MKVHLGLSILLLCLSNANAFDDEITHKELTEKAAKSSTIETALKSLGFSDGLNTKFPSNSDKSILYLLRKGSQDEGTVPTMCRASNHFHNPLKNWDQAGLSGYQGLLMSPAVDTWCLFTPYTDKYSNVVWATGYLSPSPDGNTTNTNNWMDWRVARNYYRNALTATSKTERETNFAQAFTAIGQVMHLLQDMAVPAHARNDFMSHFFFSTKNGAVPYANPFELYVKLHPSSITNSNPVSLTRLTDFWDANQYDGSNPAVTGIMMAGLSEYTNANFVSEYTLFKNFPYPSPATSVSVEDIFIPDPINAGSTIPRKYYRKTGDGDTGYLLAGVGSLQVFKKMYLGKTYTTIDEINTVIPPMDNYVHSDYADRLLPKAVGYSAGLLNYFFRGQMDMEKDQHNAGKYIIKNESTEKMEGAFALYYDDAAGNRNAVPGATWTHSINPNATSSSVSFTEPTSPAPKEKGKYILVFNGKLGMDEGAVVGRAVELDEWALLLIKQVSIESDVVEMSCIGCKGEWTQEDWAYKLSGNGHWNSYILKFDLEWLGAVNEITNVALINFYNYGSCKYNTTGDLNTTNEHSISLIRPTANNPKGYIEVHLKGNREIYWPFPRFIRVDTIDKKGNPQSLYEPIFVTVNTLYSRSPWDEGQYSGEYYKNRGLYVGSYIPYMDMCVSNKVNASYSFDLSSLEYDGFGWEEPGPVLHSFVVSEIPSYSNYYYGAYEWNGKSYKQEPLLPFFPYTVEKLKIKRTWKQSTLDFLESVGYDISELPIWDIYIDYWKTDYRP